MTIPKPKIKQIIIVVAVVILAGVLYFYFSSRSSAPAPTSSLVSQSGTSTSTTGTGGLDIGNDTAFLATLLSLGTTTIDPSIFSAGSFKSLQDNTVEISTNEVVGRVNPFIPFDTTIPSDTTTTFPEILPTNTTVNSSLFLPDFSSVPATSTPAKKN